MKKSLIGFGILLVAAQAHAGDHPGFDTRVAQAAADLAAEKMGGLRGTIGHDEQVKLVTDTVEKPVDETDLNYSRPAWQPEDNGDALPPMVHKQKIAVDRTTTGSIQSFERPDPAEPNKIMWERYDAEGQLITY